MSITSLFSIDSDDFGQEVFESILCADGVRIEKIISYGQVSPEGFWYDQDENEWVAVLDGEAQIRFDDKIITIHKGEHLNIPAHARHCVEYTANPTVWLAVFYK